MEATVKSSRRSPQRTRISDAAASRGKRLSAAMVAKGWAFNCQLAYDLQVTESSLSRWRSGGPMSVAKAIELAKHLGTSVHWLVTGQDWVDQAPSAVSPRLAGVVELFSKLSPSDRQIVIALNRAIVERQPGEAIGLSSTSREHAPAPHPVEPRP